MADLRNISGTTAGNDTKLDNVLLDVYSEEILYQAQPLLRFEQVAVIKQDLTALPGQTIKFLKYNAITGDSSIAETATIDTGTISTSTLSISVSEHAKAVAFSEMLLRTSVVDVLSDAAKLLGNHYAVQRDSLVRNTLMGSANVLYADSSGNSANTARANLDTTDLYDVNLVRDIVEFLMTNKAPKFQGDAYVSFIHPHQAKFLRKDPSWVNAQLYANPDNILTGEAGRIEDMRFIVTTQVAYIPATTQDIWADGADTATNTAVAANAVTDVYMSINVGDYSVGIAEALPVEMRDDGVVDFGRTHAIAWYGIYGAGLLETGHAVIGESA